MASKCANCLNDAMYEYKITAESSVLYCGRHLPKFLESRRAAGTLEITPALSENLDSAITVLAPETPEESVEEPKKKVTKKKAE